MRGGKRWPSGRSADVGAVGLLLDSATMFGSLHLFAHQARRRSCWYLPILAAPDQSERRTWLVVGATRSSSVVRNPESFAIAALVAAIVLAVPGCMVEEVARRPSGSPPRQGRRARTSGLRTNSTRSRLDRTPHPSFAAHSLPPPHRCGALTLYLSLLDDRRVWRSQPARPRARRYCLHLELRSLSGAHRRVAIVPVVSWMLPGVQVQLLVAPRSAALGWSVGAVAIGFVAAAPDRWQQATGCGPRQPQRRRRRNEPIA